MTTIVADHVDANVYDTALERHPYFSWGAVIAGAFAAGIVTFMLLAIGAGLGLMLAGPVNNPAPLKTILTAGGIYFFAVEAFGFAVGGYIAGRLCGPVLQSRDEEMFRSGVHGLVVWAVSAAAGILFLAIGAAVAANTAINFASAFGMSPTSSHDAAETTPATAAYWTDSLFRGPATAAPASTTTTAPAQTAPTVSPPVEVSPAPAPAPTELPAAPAENTAPATPGTPNEDLNTDLGNEPSGDDNGNSNSTNGDEEQPQPFTPSPAVYVPNESAPRALLVPAQYTTTTSADGSVSSVTRVDPDARGEVARILLANAAAPTEMRADDRQFIEQTIVSQTGISQANAQQRLDALLSRIHAQQTKAAETARKAAAYINIWLGLALFFGLLVATAAAVIARMEEEDKGEEAGSVRVAPKVTIPPAAPAV